MNGRGATTGGALPRFSGHLFLAPPLLAGPATGPRHLSRHRRRLNRHANGGLVPRPRHRPGSGTHPSTPSGAPA